MLCAPPPKLTVSEWADEHRILSPEDSAEPGRWRTSRMEPMRGIMDTYNDPTVEETVVIKGTQVGYTAVLGNVVGYVIDQDPAPVLLMQPTKAMGEEWSKARLAPMLRDTVRLRGKVADPRSRDSGNTILNKEFPGGRIAIIGANAPAEIASRPIKVVLCDEIDRYPASAGSEGDPMKLAEKRQETFPSRKRFKASSPTIKGQSAVERDYNRSDKRRYYIACPHCDHQQTLRWEQVKWDKAADGAHKPETAHYQCEDCGVLLTDAERWRAVADAPTKIDPITGQRGGWRATAPFRGIAGFHLSQLYSSWVKLEKIVTEFLTAYGKLPGTHPDVQLMKVFTNTVLAETWEDKGETLDSNGLANRGEAYGPDDLPDAALMATAGVDTQGNRLEVQVIAWGPDEESWPCLYAVIPGDPAQGQVWAELDQLLRQPLQTASGRIVRIRAACIDAGGHHAAQVHAFCRDKVARRIFPIVGVEGPKLIWPIRSSRSKHGRVWPVGQHTAKDSIYGRLRLRPRPDGEPNPGFIHFPLADPTARTEGFGPDYFAQLTVEKVETRYREGRPYRLYVKKPAERNEALDTFVYALAARMSMTHVRLRARPAAPAADEPEAGAGLPSDAASAAPPVAVPAAVMKHKPTGRLDPAAVARMFRR